MAGSSADFKTGKCGGVDGLDKESFRDQQCELTETSPKQISQKFDKIQFSAYPAKSEEIDLQDKEKKYVSVSH